MEYKPAPTDNLEQRSRTPRPVPTTNPTPPSNVGKDPQQGAK